MVHCCCCRYFVNKKDALKKMYATNSAVCMHPQRAKVTKYYTRRGQDYVDYAEIQYIDDVENCELFEAGKCRKGFWEFWK